MQQESAEEEEGSRRPRTPRPLTVFSMPPSPPRARRQLKAEIHEPPVPPPRALPADTQDLEESSMSSPPPPPDIIQLDDEDVCHSEHATDMQLFRQGRGADLPLDNMPSWVAQALRNPPTFAAPEEPKPSVTGQVDVRSDGMPPLCGTVSLVPATDPEQHDTCEGAAYMAMRSSLTGLFPAVRRARCTRSLTLAWVWVRTGPRCPLALLQTDTSEVSPPLRVLSWGSRYQHRRQGPARRRERARWVHAIPDWTCIANQLHSLAKTLTAKFLSSWLCTHFCVLRPVFLSAAVHRRPLPSPRRSSSPSKAIPPNSDHSPADNLHQPGCVSATHSYTASCPGPKSWGGRLLGALLIQSLIPSRATATDARVAGIVTRPAEACRASSITSSLHEAKHRGTDVTHQHESSVQQTVYAQLSKTGKRSFHRAVRRANANGSTMYRGRLHTLKSLGSAPRHSVASPSTESRHHAPSYLAGNSPSRWRIMAWNTGGLTTAKLLEVETWLEQCHARGSMVHVCILTETHWSFTSEWELASYNVVHSGLSNRQAGILVLVHKTLVPGSAIRFTADMPGRLMMLRLETSPATYVVATYQHVWSETPSADDCLAAREIFWTKLAATIRSVPWRAQLVVAGDLNTPCVAQAPFVGEGLTPITGEIRQRDQPRLQQLLTQFNLVALNTWGRRKHCHTYQFEHTTSVHRTQIDFILCRAHHADPLAKSARPIRAPFVPDRGMRHFPLLTTLPSPVEPRQSKPKRTTLTAKVVALSLQEDTKLADRFSRQAGALMPPCLVGDPAAALNKVLHQAWQNVCPPRPPSTRAPEHRAVGLVRRLWELRRQRAQLPPRTFSVLRGWLQAARLSRVQRLLRQACKDKKRERVSALLQEAESSRHPSAIFSVVRRLAPKSRTMRVQLRDKDGRLLAGAEESEHIAAYLRTVYHSTDTTAAPREPPFTGMKFEEADLIQALNKLGAGKALPAGFVPARLWKLAPTQVVRALLPAMNVTASALEASWHRVQLHLIPKVQLVKEPKNLRPIALLHPANKLLATMIADKVQDKVLAYLTHVPQWAYLQGRSTSDALTAVCAHMHQVRELLASQTRSLPQRFQGCERQQVIGGVSISLDVKKAFDSLSHAFLAEAMRDAEFERTEIDLILHLHSQACLCVGSHRDSAQIFLGTGVRQGCSLSPLLWSLATGRFYRLYLTALKNQGLSEGLTNMFADDVFGSWVFKSPEAFKKAIRAIGVLVHTLQQVGLQLSMEKTVVLLAIAGTSSPSLLSKYKAQIDNVPHLQIPVGRDKLAFKIVSSHKYLGAKVSYRGFELLNLKHRLNTAWGCFWRLHHILIHRSLSLSTRVRLWQACVFSVLRYSLHSVGLPAQGPSMIRHAVHRQLRLIARSPAHLWHVTTQDILQRLQVRDPWSTLCEQYHALQQRPALLTGLKEVAPWLLCLNHTFAAETCTGLAAGPHPHTLVNHTPQAVVAQRVRDQRDARNVHSYRHLVCQVCSRHFDSLGALRLHAAHAHKREVKSLNSAENTTPAEKGLPEHPPPASAARTDGCKPAQARRSVQVHAQAALLSQGLPEALQSADPQTRFVWLHSQQGLCVCRHCQRVCNTWDDLKVHIFSKACSVLFPNAADQANAPLPLNELGVYWDGAVTPLTACGWEKVAKHLRTARDKCYRFCPICNQGLVRARGLTQHLKAFHGWALPLLNTARSHTKSHRRGLALCSPCRYCELRFRCHQTKHAAVCPMIVFSKLAVLLHHPQALPDGPRRSFTRRPLGGCSRAPTPPDNGASGGQLRGVSAHEIYQLRTPSSSSDPGGFTDGPPVDRPHDCARARPALEVHPPQREGARPWERAQRTSGQAATLSCRNLRQSTLFQTGLSGACRQSSTAGPPARGLLDGSGAEHVVGDVRRHGPASQHNCSAGQSGRAMAQYEGGVPGVHQASSANNPLSDVGVRAQDQARGSHHRPSQPSGGGSSPGPDRARHPQVQALEPCPSRLGRCGHEGPALPARGDWTSGGGHSSQQSGRCAGELPLHTEATAGDVRAHSDLCAGAGAQRAKVVQDVEHHRHTVGQCSADVSRHNSPQRAPLSVPAGPVSHAGSATAVTCLQFRRIVLLNRDNECYANSTLLACAWTSALFQPSQDSMREQLHADLSNCLSSCAPVHIWSRPLWRRCLRFWPHSGRQQDAADFLSHLFQAADLRHFQGAWAVLSGGCLRDCGSVCPVTLSCDVRSLPVVRGIYPLQGVIDQWHNSPACPAFAAGTTCVALQLNRFCTEGRVVRKLHVAVSLPLRVHLPCWVEGSLSRREYRLSAAIVHLGSTPRSGHYRALLVEDSGRMWWTDDGDVARPPIARDADTLLRNAYVLFFRPVQ